MIFLTFEHILTHIAFSVGSIIITIHFLTLFAKEKEVLEKYNSAKKGTIVSFVCITGLLITRWIYYGHLPLSDLYESLIFLSWSFILVQIFYFVKKKKINLSAITALSAIFTQGFATSGLLMKIEQSTILVPALQSRWLMMHVSMIVLGYAALLCGSLFAIAILIISFRKQIILLFKLFLKKSYSFLTNILNGSFSFKEQKKNINLNKTRLRKPYSFIENEEFKNYYFKNYDFCAQQKLIKGLDQWSFLMIRLGFVFLTIGILSGAVWANESWGSYWNWDPKETWAFISWSIFAIYLHIRRIPFVTIKSAAILASAGFLIIWICYFGVNLLGIGLHSYGSFNAI